MSDEKLNQSLYDKLAELDIRVVRLEVGTEERHKAYVDKHDQLLDSMSKVQTDVQWFGRLLIGGFITIVITMVTIALKQGG